MAEPRIVKGEGNLSSKIYLIGEAPGATEELKGKPFCGGAGWELDKILKAAGIERKECYIDNVMQERPKNNDFSIFYEDKAKTKPTRILQEGYNRISRLVLENRPNVVCALGNEALQALTGKKAITKWRGSILGCHGIKVIPTIHPAMVMRQYEFFPTTVFDMTRVKEESRTPDWPQAYADDFLTNPSFEKIMETLELLHKERYVCFDIETAQNQIVCLGFGWSKTNALCIPIFFGGNSWWTSEQELAIVKSIKRLFMNTSVNFIAQNAQYDMIYLADKWGVEVPNLWLDTMIAFHCVYPELPKGLDFLSSIYTHRPYHKDDAHNNPGPDGMWHYNCLDTVVTWEAAMAIHKELEEFGTLDFYNNYSHKLITPLIKMQRHGLKIDVDYRAKLDAKLEADIIRLQAKVDEAVGHPLNVNSPLQMKNFLYKELGLPEQTKRKTGSVTADEDALAKLAKQFPNPLFEIILEIRHIRKVLSTYVRATLDEDNRMRTSYVITGTTTGRLASRTSIYGTGCLLPEAQVLTPVGWERLDELGSATDVMQWSPNGEMQFVNANVVKFPFNGDMLEANSDFHRNVYTPEHRIPTAVAIGALGNIFNKEIFVKPAIVALKENTFYLPVSGNYNGSRAFPLIRVLVMAQADGSIECGSIRVSFKKQRKIDRFLMLIKEHGLRYTEQKCNRKDYRRFCICVEDSKPIVELLGKHKLFDSYVLLFDNQTLKEFVDELQYWDGHIRGSSFQYYTGVEQNACIAATVAHLCGYSASTRVVPSRTFAPMELQKVIPGKLMYTVAIKPRTFIQTGKGHVTKHPYTGEVYCVTTESGFFLTRYKDRICITGNTNLQNIDRSKEIRKLFVADTGTFFVNADLSQAEARVVAYIAKEERLKAVFAEGGDIHKRNASIIFTKPVEKVTGDERQLAKTLVHAANYGIGVRKFAQTIGTDENHAHQLLNLYHANYPRIKRWHAEVEEELRRSRTLTTPLGRKRMFFGRWGEDLVREAVAYVPQSTVGDVLNYGIVRCANSMPQGWTMVMQNHDAILMQVPNSTDLMHVVRFIKHYFEFPIIINDEYLTIPVDIKVGKSWGWMHKVGAPHAKKM